MSTSNLQSKLNAKESYAIIQSYFDETNETIESLKGKDRLEQMEDITKDYSYIHALLILLRDYHYQVNNGGHMQYVDNSYHTTEGNGFFANATINDNIHQELISLMERFISENETQYCDDELSIMKDMKLSIDTEESSEEQCSECNGQGTIEDDGEDDEDCDYCDASGYVDEPNPEYKELDYDTHELFSKLDTRYYAINDNVIIEIGNILKSNN
jgi:hypothetical protein